MIVVAIVSILVAVALPAYNDQMRKSRRTEAKQILSDLQLKQEKWRSNHATYGTSTTVNTSNVQISNTSSHYTVAMTVGSNTATGYIYRANPNGDQAADKCGILTLRMVNGAVIKEPLPATVAGCW